MRSRQLLAATALAFGVTLVACSSSENDAGSGGTVALSVSSPSPISSEMSPSMTTRPAVAPGSEPSPSTAPSATSVDATADQGGLDASAESAGQDMAGRVVRFSAGSTSVEVTIGQDTPATRDFLSMLPLTLRLEEFSGREKIAALPRELSYEGSVGSDPENGDLIYFVPWGNIGFYYNADGIGYSDQTLHLGTFNASPEVLALLEGKDVSVQVVD